jgi:hypothetical protein
VTKDTRGARILALIILFVGGAGFVSYLPMITRSVKGWFAGDIGSESKDAHTIRVARAFFDTWQHSGAASVTPLFDSRASPP